MNESHIGDLWLLLSAYIDKDKIADAAEHYVEFLVDNGVTERVLQSSLGVDDPLDEAISYYLEEVDDDQEEIDF